MPTPSVSRSSRYQRVETATVVGADNEIESQLGRESLLLLHDASVSEDTELMGAEMKMEIADDGRSKPWISSCCDNGHHDGRGSHWLVRSLVTLVLTIAVLCVVAIPIAMMVRPDVGERAVAAITDTVNQAQQSIASLAQQSIASLAQPTPTSLTHADYESLNHCRLMRAMERARSGVPLRMAAVGGSITRHSGVEVGYAELLASRFDVRYPVNGSHHTMANRAISASGSALTATCMSSMFPHNELNDIDILFVEFAVNDMGFAAVHNKDLPESQLQIYLADFFSVGVGGEAGEFDPASNMERMVRYALTRERAGGDRRDGPAVVFIYFCRMEGLTAKEIFEPIAQYYGVPAVDVCELWPFTYPSDAVAKERKLPQWESLHNGREDIHPNYGGHAVVAAMISDHLGGIRPDAFRERSCRVHQSSTEALLPPAMFPFNVASSAWRCTVGKFHPGGFGGFDASGFSPYNVSANNGWEYADETGNSKWGWTTTQPKATIVFVIQPTTSELVLNFLRTRSNVGSVLLWLESADGTAKSMELRVDAWWDQKVSTFEFFAIPREIFGGRSYERLHLQLLDVGAPVQDPPTKKPANKFKLVSILER